jgi:tetratricopeptide (TPR) repeat protein
MAFRKAIAAPYVVGPVPTIAEPPGWEILLRETTVLYRLGRKEEARKCLESTVQMGLTPTEAAKWVVEHLLCLEEYDLAGYILEKDMGEYLPVAEFHFYMGLSLLFSDVVNKAFRHLSIAAEKHRPNVDARRGIAAGCLITGQYQRSLRLYRELVMEGVKEKDVLFGGIFSSTRRNFHHLELFVKALREITKKPYDSLKIERIVDLIRDFMKREEVEKNLLTFLLLKAVIKAIQKSQG